MIFSTRPLSGKSGGFFSKPRFPAAEADVARSGATGGATNFETPASWQHPLAHSSTEYVSKRYALENHNLRLWRDAGIGFEELAYLVPTLLESTDSMAQRLAEFLQSKAYL